MPAPELTPLQRLQLNQHVNRLKQLTRELLSQALEAQESRMRQLLLSGQEVTVNLQLEILPKVQQEPPQPTTSPPTAKTN